MVLDEWMMLLVKVYTFVEVMMYVCHLYLPSMCAMPCSQQKKNNMEISIMKD